MCTVKNQSNIQEIEEHNKLVEQCDYFVYNEDYDSYEFNENYHETCVSTLKSDKSLSLRIL